MKAHWEKVIRENMQEIEFPGRDTPLFKPKGHKGSVWILTDVREYPSVPPPMDRHDMAPSGGHEIDLDPADPEFLIVRKVIGMCEYTHCIPWSRILDIVFFQMAN
jgi:hypothetical protein